MLLGIDRAPPGSSAASAAARALRAHTHTHTTPEKKSSLAQPQLKRVVLINHSPIKRLIGVANYRNRFHLSAEAKLEICATSGGGGCGGGSFNCFCAADMRLFQIIPFYEDVTSKLRCSHCICCSCTAGGRVETIFWCMLHCIISRRCGLIKMDIFDHT